MLNYKKSVQLHTFIFSRKSYNLIEIRLFGMTYLIKQGLKKTSFFLKMFFSFYIVGSVTLYLIDLISIPRLIKYASNCLATRWQPRR